jgi:mRNA interferase MazF
MTTNLSRAGDSRHLCVDLSTVEGQQSGLLHDSVVSRTNLATVHEDRMGRVIGHLSESALRRLDDCLKAALGLP